MDARERGRHELLARLEQVLGPEHAAALMENPPPQPWSELTTKDDLAVFRDEVRGEFAHLRETLDLRFAAQDARFEAFVRERVDSQTKLLVFSIIGALLTTAGVALGAAAA